MAKTKQAKAREFNARERDKIKKRDSGECIFCKCGYTQESAEPYDLRIKSIMHFIPRSRNGLGIEQNGAVGCQYHHNMLDNGNNGRRGEMLQIFKTYLQQKYPGWDETKLTYNKWSWMEDSND